LTLNEQRLDNGNGLLGFNGQKYPCLPINSLSKAAQLLEAMDEIAVINRCHLQAIAAANVRQAQEGIVPEGKSDALIDDLVVDFLAGQTRRSRLKALVNQIKVLRINQPAEN